VQLQTLLLGVDACRCLDDYVDVYTQAQSEVDDLLSVPLHGRYCGNDLEKLPALLISMTNILVVGFFTTNSTADGVNRFRANYSFIDDCKLHCSHLTHACFSETREHKLNDTISTFLMD